MFTTHYYIHAQIAVFWIFLIRNDRSQIFDGQGCIYTKKKQFYSYITKAEAPRPYRQNKES